MFIEAYRQTIVDLIVAAWYGIGSIVPPAWRSLRNNVTPARLGVMGAVLAGLISAAIFLPYAIIGAGLLAIGVIIGKFKVAFVLMAILGLSGMVLALPKFGFFNPLRWANSWVMRPITYVLVICLLASAGWWIFGVFSPKTQESLGRAAKNGAIQTANWLDKQSLQSEKESGIFARVSVDCRVYNNSGQSITSLKNKDLVYVLDTEGKAKTMDGEGMTHVMLPNQDGDFIGGKRGWVPSRNINWDWKEKSTSQKTAKVKGLTFEGSEFFTQLKDQLGEGRYRLDVEPASAAKALKVRIRDASGTIKEDRSLKEGYILIGNGEKGTAIGTEVPIVLNINKV